ncbi:MAG: hypothetical protein JNK78_00085 [Planctomycetes bacterium]|nr:hypothetical protein [Planctomycetota bacterium]
MTDALLPNLLLFATGQAAAWYYLRTGRWWIGVLASGALWVIADWYFLARFAFAAESAELLVPLVAMQVVAVWVVLALAFALWRRRWSATARRRAEIYGEGMVAYLRGDHRNAERTFRRLVRTDPWDAAAWVGLGNVGLRTGAFGQARRCFRRALGVDTKTLYADFVKHQMTRLAAPPAA